MPEQRPYRPAYKNTLIVSGAMLLVLGIGNWLIGSIRVGPYEEYLAQHPAPLASPESLKNALLHPTENGREESRINLAKREFYQLVRVGGRLMVVVGSLSLVAGALTVDRPRVDNVPRNRDGATGQNPDSRSFLS